MLLAPVVPPTGFALAPTTRMFGPGGSFCSAPRARSPSLLTDPAPRVPPIRERPMTPRKRNLLEAFQKSETVPDLPAPAARRAKAAPSLGLEPAGGPLAEPGARPRSAAPAGAAGEGLPRLVPLALAVLLVGFWLGRLSSAWWGSPAPRGERADLAFETRVSDGAPAASAPAAHAQAASQTQDPTVGGYTADDLAFLDRANKVTLRAIFFDTTPSGQALALESYHHLRRNGLPAVAPFVAGDLTLICIGAAPSVRDPELARLREVLRTLPGPPPRSEPNPYASAFLVNIDDVVLRD